MPLYGAGFWASRLSSSKSYCGYGGVWNQPNNWINDPDVGPWNKAMCAFFTTTAWRWPLLRISMRPLPLPIA